MTINFWHFSIEFRVVWEYENIIQFFQVTDWNVGPDLWLQSANTKTTLCFVSKFRPKFCERTQRTNNCLFWRKARVQILKPQQQDYFWAILWSRDTITKPTKWMILTGTQIRIHLSKWDFRFIFETFYIFFLFFSSVMAPQPMQGTFKNDTKSTPKIENNLCSCPNPPKQCKDKVTHFHL